MMNQSRISAWVRKVFTEAESKNAPERSLRVVEEAVELSQACGVDSETLHRLVDYVCSRPIGEAPKEIAGCLVTVYAAAAALGVDAQEELEKEISRIHQPEVIDRVRRRQHEKRAALVATPERAASGLEGPKRTSARPAGRDDPVCGWAQCENTAVIAKGGLLLCAKHADVRVAPVCGCGRPSTHESGWCGRECEAKFGDKVMLVR
jgi:hypothetical protein